MEIRGDTLRLNPDWPEELGVLEFTMRYRAHMLTLRVAGKQVRVSARPGVQPPIRLAYDGGIFELGPGEAVELPPPATGLAGGPVPLGRMRPRHQPGRPPRLVLRDGYQPRSSPTISAKALLCRSTWAAVVAGDMSAMLWNGVSSTPRFSIAR